MKKTALIGLLALSTTLGAFASSTNYRDIKTNDDGTTTIVGPRFKTATGSNSNLSGESNSDGVCRLYGFDFMVGDSKITTGDDRDKTSVINLEGKYSGYRSYTSNSYNRIITSIVCARDRQALTISTRLEPIQNDDGSYTILNPKMGYYNNGMISNLSAKSNINGICKYFGLERAVQNTLISTGDDREKTIILDQNGSFSGFDIYSSNAYNRIVTSVVCEGNISSGGNGRDDLDETIEITKRELNRMQAQIRKLEELNRDLTSELSKTQAEKASLKSQLERSIAELENETRLNGKAKKELAKLKAQLKRLAEEELK